MYHDLKTGDLRLMLFHLHPRGITLLLEHIKKELEQFLQLFLHSILLI